MIQGPGVDRKPCDFKTGDLPRDNADGGTCQAALTSFYFVHDAILQTKGRERRAFDVVLRWLKRPELQPDVLLANRLVRLEEKAKLLSGGTEIEEMSGLLNHDQLSHALAASKRILERVHSPDRPPAHPAHPAPPVVPAGQGAYGENPTGSVVEARDLLDVHRGDDGIGVGL